MGFSWMLTQESQEAESSKTQVISCLELAMEELLLGQLKSKAGTCRNLQTPTDRGRDILTLKHSNCFQSSRGPFWNHKRSVNNLVLQYGFI